MENSLGKKISRGIHAASAPGRALARGGQQPDDMPCCDRATTRFVSTAARLFLAVAQPSMSSSPQAIHVL